MLRRLLILFPLLLIGLISQAQQPEPLDLAKKIFDRKPFPELAKYRVDEYNGHPNGSDLQKGATTSFLLLGQTDKTAVVAMTVFDASKKGVDTYLHFKKDTVWKLRAFRTLALTNIIEQAVEELEKMTPKQIDEAIAKSVKTKQKTVRFASREDYLFTLGNARLVLKMDSQIIEHFNANKAEFERLRKAALMELASKDRDVDRIISLLENLKTDYQKLFISSVDANDYQLGSRCLNFVIGGMIDNTVGFLYVKDRKDLPEMSPSPVIMLREIGDGWYLYKTT